MPKKACVSRAMLQNFAHSPDMHEVLPKLLWIGNAGDLHKPAQIEIAGIKAVIQVALAEQMPTMSRELLFAHYPIMDGAGNPRGIVAAAVETTATLLRHRVPTLVCCSGGMSRSPSIAAGAIAVVQGIPPQDALMAIIQGQPHDVSPGIWESVVAVVEQRARS